MIAPGKRVQVVGTRETGRCGTVTELNRCSADTVRLWYVRLDRKGTLRTHTVCFWESELEALAAVAVRWGTEQQVSPLSRGEAGEAAHGDAPPSASSQSTD